MKKEIKKESDILQKLTLAFEFYFLVFFPLALDKTKYIKITEGKLHFFYAGLCAFLIAYIIVSIAYKIKIKKPDISQFCIIAFALWACVSALASDYGKDVIMGQGRFEGLLSTLSYSVLFILVGYSGIKNKFIPRLMAAGAVIFGFISVTQFFSKGVIYPDGMWYWGSSFIGTIGNIDIAAGYYSIVVPFLVAYYVFYKDDNWSLVALGGILLIMFSFLVSGVDSAKLGIVAGLAISLPFLLGSRQNIIRTLTAYSVIFAAMFFWALLNLDAEGIHLTFGLKTIFLLLCTVFTGLIAFLLTKINKEVRIPVLAAYAFIILCVVAVLVFIFFYDGSNKLISEASQMLHGNLSDDAGSGRGYLWKTTIMLIKQKPILGYGPGTFLEVFRPYETFNSTTDFCHNDYLQIAQYDGLVGLGLYLAYMVSLAVRLFKNASKEPFLILLGGALAGYWVYSVFAFSICLISPFYWCVAGLADSLVRKAENR